MLRVNIPGPQPVYARVSNMYVYIYIYIYIYMYMYVYVCVVHT